MPLLSLEDEVRSEIAHIVGPSRPVFFLVSFEEVKAGHRPGWPLAYSFILHELAIIAIVLLSIVGSRFHRIPEAESLKLNPTDHVIYLPVLGGGSEGNGHEDRKSTRLNSSHRCISYAVFCLKKKKIKKMNLIHLYSSNTTPTPCNSCQ